MVSVEFETKPKPIPKKSLREELTSTITVIKSAEERLSALQGGDTQTTLVDLGEVRRRIAQSNNDLAVRDWRSSLESAVTKIEQVTVFDYQPSVNHDPTPVVDRPKDDDLYREEGDLDGVIRVSQLADYFNIPARVIARVMNEIGIEAIITGSQRTRHIRMEDFAAVKEFVTNKKSQEGKVVGQGEIANRKPSIRIVDVPEGALPNWKFREILRGDAPWVPLAIKELGIEQVVIANKYYITVEDQQKIRERIGQIRSESRTRREALNLGRVGTKSSDEYKAPEGSVRFWDFSVSLGISEDKLNKIIKSHGVAVLRVRNRKFLTLEAQNKIAEAIQEEAEAKKVNRLGVSLEEHGRLSAIARLIRLSSEDQERRTKITRVFEPKGAKKQKEPVLAEAPEGYITLGEMWRELGITHDGTRLKVRKTYDLPYVKIGNRKYFEKEAVLALKEEVDLDELSPRKKVDRSVDRLPKAHDRVSVPSINKETTSVVLPDPEEWATAAEVRKLLGISDGKWDHTLDWCRDQITIQKAGGKNFIKRSDIEVIREVVNNRVDGRKVGRGLVLGVEDELDKEYLASVSAGDLISIRMQEIGRYKFSKEKNFVWGKEMFDGSLAMKAIGMMSDAGLLNERQLEQLNKILNNRTIKLIIKNFDSNLGPVKDIRNPALAENHAKSLEYIANSIVDSWVRIEALDSDDIAKRERDTELMFKEKIEEAKRGRDAFDNLISHNLRLAFAVAKKFRGRGVGFEDLIGYAEEGMLTGAAKYNFHYGFEFSTYATWWIKQNLSRKLQDETRPIRLPIHVSEKMGHVIREEEKLRNLLGRDPTERELIRSLGKDYKDAIGAKKLLNVRSLNAALGDGDDSGELGDIVAAEEVDFDGVVEGAELRDVIKVALGFLNENERKVIEIRFGLGGQERTVERKKRTQKNREASLDTIGDELGRTRERARQIEARALEKLRRILADYYIGAENNLLKSVRLVNVPDKGDEGKPEVLVEPEPEQEPEPVIFVNRLQQSILGGKSVNDDGGVGSEVTIDDSNNRVERRLPVISRLDETITIVNGDRSRSSETEQKVDNSERLTNPRDGYASPNEIIDELKITRQRWHQAKGKYTYRFVTIGRGEYILWEDLLRIKEERANDSRARKKEL